MLENLYTTKMSGNTKMLQKRFTKIRSHKSRKSKIMAAIVAMTLAATALFATVALAAVGSDGLEYWDRNEIYFLAGLKGNVTVDIKDIPEWVKQISSDGKIEVFVKRADMRDTKGIVTHNRIVYCSGDIGTTELYQTSTSGYRGANGEELLLVFDTNNNEINPNGVYIKFPDKEEMSYGGMDFEYFIDDMRLNGFIKLDNTEQIGDFVGIDKIYQNGICINYYTYFENLFRNRAVDGIDLSIVSADENYITAKIAVNIPEAYNIEICICEPKTVPLIGFLKPYKLSEVNGKELKLTNIYQPKKFENGKTYAVNYILTDRDENVIYRQQDYVTVK